MLQFPDKEYPIRQQLLPRPSKRRSGRPADRIRFLVAHDTGNPGSTAAGNVKYYTNSCNDIAASAHLFVDDREIVECLPALTAAPEKAWHVLYNTTEDKRRYGCHANDAAIGVEYCYGPHINADEAYRRYVWLLAYLCWYFRLDPAKSVIGHFKLDPQRKRDPQSGLAASRRTYEQLLLDVPAMYARCTGLGHSDHVLGTETGVLTARGRMNVRYGEPFRRAPSRLVADGTRLRYVARVEGENIEGNSHWFSLPDGEYCWSGAVNAQPG